MCGRYFVDEDAVDRIMKGLIGEMNRSKGKTGEIFPGDTVLAVANSRAMHPKAFPMEWGFTGFDGKRLINARSETAADKPMFRDSLQRRRCLLPAVNYFEWNGGRKYAIRPEGDGFFLAGLYRLENEKPMFSVLTRESAAPISFIHDRMPVILTPRMLGAWMDPESDPVRLMRDAVTAVEWVKLNG